MASSKGVTRFSVSLPPSLVEVFDDSWRNMGYESRSKGAHDAFSNAGLAKTSIPREEIGFFAGMGMVDYDMEDLLPAVLESLDAEGKLDCSAFYVKGYTEIYPLWPLSMLNNISFCQVATRDNLRRWIYCKNPTQLFNEKNATLTM